MARPKKASTPLKERLERLRAAGLINVAGKALATPAEEDELLPLPQRVQKILNIVQLQPKKATTMNYLVLYDIEDNKVRHQVAKYLEKQGCLRIQKSVFMANSTHPRFLEIHETLKDINSYYENTDSIILVPVNVADVRSMKLIGCNVNIDVLTEPPNTMFF